MKPLTPDGDYEVIRVYFCGDVGDPQNLEIFNADTHELLAVKEVKHLRMAPNEPTTCQLDFLNCWSASVEVVKAPNQVRHVPTDCRKTLYEVRLEKRPDMVRQSTRYEVMLIPHIDDGYGTRRADTGNVRMAAREIDDYMMARAEDSKQILHYTIADLGAMMGKELLLEAAAEMERQSRPMHYRDVCRYDFSNETNFGAPPIPNGQRIDQMIMDDVISSHDPEPEEERTEGDLLLEFFRTSAHDRGD